MSWAYWALQIAALLIGGAIVVQMGRWYERRRARKPKRDVPSIPEPRQDYRFLPWEKHPCPRCGADMYGNPAVVGYCAACHEVAFERKVREDKAQFRAMGFADQDEADRQLKASIERKLMAVPPSNERRVILFDDDDDKEAS